MKGDQLLDKRFDETAVLLYHAFAFYLLFVLMFSKVFE